MSVANCPSCGAPIEFAIGSSAVVICRYCNSVVARTDRGIEAHGKVAALIETGSPLQIGTTGKYRKTGFRVTGRTQLRHQAGGVWDEWYAAFDDGRWGWLAEAQGRFYLTFRTEAAAPPLDQLRLGEPVETVDSLVVAEIGKAELASAEGELPWRPEPGYSYEYADLSGSERKFATIDYSEEPPVVFKGEETTLAGLGVSGESLRKTRVAVVALQCPNCAGALELKAPDQTERVWCPYCGSGLDVSAGKLSLFQLAKKKRKDVQPAIPLGTTGTIDGKQYVVAGFMQRSVHFDKAYYWTEYLLYNREKGFRWLVNSDDHWSFVTPLRPGEVRDSMPAGAAGDVYYDGRRYRLFQNATAKVTYVLGEFYWKVAAGEQVNTSDYIAPPFGISKEVTTSGASEIAYSHARYMKPEEVEEAFGLKNLPRPRTTGPMQPFPGSTVGVAWAVMLLLLFIVTFVLASTKPNRTVIPERMYDASIAPDAPVEGVPENTRMFFTDGFDLSGKHNVVVEVRAPLDNAWLYVTGDLVSEATGKFQSFDFPLEYYSGVDQGERWSEGKRVRRIYLSRPEKGRYAMRIGAQWEAGKTPPPLYVKVREGVFRWPYFILALLGISVIPFVAALRKVSWEAERWKDSDHSPFKTITTEEDEDEE
ncbi:MAG TPA: DUF4178 domain-containing protein [Thermoanaerobaculia bacterium]|nr:DUF4178 domain-containing protein [Thermoanaerobaculia bacterium]